MAKGIKFFSKLSSLVANATFFIKNADFDEIISRMILNNAEPESGPQIDNAQKEINQSMLKRLEYLSLPANGQLTLNEYSTRQLLVLQGATMAVTLDLQPFGTSVFPVNGSEIILMGYDNTNTVRVNHNDSQYGCLLNGDAILQKGFMIGLIYDETLERYIERTRNF